MAIRLDQPLDHVLLITIDRPERKNAFDLHHFRDLTAAWQRLRDDDDLWLAIITGVDGCFMAGADLRDYVPQITALAEQINAAEVTEIDGCKLSDGTDAVLRNAKLYKPIIAAIDGPCLAGGMEMLGGIDIRVATQRATFGVMEPKRGLFAGGGTTARLPRQLSYPAAMEFLLCADEISAERALELGLLNQVVADEAELMPAALRYAERILANGPLAVRATKESVVRGLSGTLRDAYKIESELSKVVFASADAKEGPLAFVEKRAPELAEPLSDVTRHPVLAGWGQVSRFDGEPLAAWAEALRATGVDPARIDSLDVVYCQSWQYDDPARRLVEAVGADPARLHYSGIGGTTPLRLIAEAAERVRAGEAEVCAVVGGEALATARRHKKAGERLTWSHRHPDRPPFPFEAPFHPAEVAHEVFQAYTTFALRDVARRARLGVEPEAYRRGLGELFAPFTEVAAANRHAWFPEVRTPADLTDVTPDNRLVAYPYTKRVMAIMDVDLAGAVIVASADAARAMGVADDRRVHLRGTGAAEDPVYVAEHPDLSRAPGLAAATSQALARGGVGIDDVAHFDLYSCFPASVHYTLDALGLDVIDPRPFTVTGGLPYAGGPGSCYSLLAVAAMADRLVDDPGSLGLVTAVGMHLSKHAALVLSTVPGPGANTVDVAPFTPEASRLIEDRYTGPATIAGYTVLHGGDGGATSALVIADIDDRHRCYATTTDPDLLDSMERDEWVGAAVTIAAGDAGRNEVHRS